MKHNSRREIAWLAGALAALVILAVLRSNASRAVSSVPSTYDAGANGYAALYDFLHREHVPVARFQAPLSDLPRSGTLVLAGDYALERIAFAAHGPTELEKWVRHGGQLVVLGATAAFLSDALGLPPSRIASASHAWTGCGFHGDRLQVAAEFPATLPARCSARSAVWLVNPNGPVAVAVKRGRGRIVEIVTPQIFDNLRLTRDSNAAFAYDLFSSRAPVAFDERIYGYIQGRSFFAVLPWPVRIAVAISLFALLLAIIGANLPFAPPKSIEGSVQRDSFAYITSLARLMQRGHAARDAIMRLVKTAHTFHAPGPGDAAGCRAFAELNDLAGKYAPAPADVLRAGLLFAALRKDYQ